VTITPKDNVTMSGNMAVQLIDALEAAITFAEEAAEEFYGEDDESKHELGDDWHQKAQDYRELRDFLKVKAGLAKDFYDHFEWVEEPNGDRVEFDFGHKFTKEELTRVWTIVSGDNAELVPIPGRKVVNRMAYHLTTKPWTAKDETTDWTW
jgi:PAS domain-containing protein